MEYLVAMNRQSRTFLGMVAIMGVVCLLFMVNQTDLADDRLPNRRGLLLNKAQEEIEPYDQEAEPTLSEVEHVLQELLIRDRQQIDTAMADFKFDNEGIIKSVDDLIPEKGGKPLVRMVVTTWRSGSTFLGDVMHSHPASFYHYEPLLPYGINQVRSGTHGEHALADLKNLMKCDYSTNMDHYLTFGKNNKFLHSHNHVMSDVCNEIGRRCYEPAILSQFCKLYPIQTMKTVRLRANLTEHLLNDPSIRLKVLLLVRDPRAIMQSRNHRVWCPGQPDCDDASRLCSDLVNDYYVAKDLIRKHPTVFSVVRYEDMSLDVYNKTKEILQFFDIDYTRRVEAFLETHTKESMGGVSSTFRDSKHAATHWKQDLRWAETRRIQAVCGRALELWRYGQAANETHLRSFDPVQHFSFSPPLLPILL